MKLLTLSFSNLNSLKGHWHIDFTIRILMTEFLPSLVKQVRVKPRF